MGGASGARWIVLTLAAGFTGFGLYPSMAIGWVAFFVAIGTVVFSFERKSEVGAYGLGERIAYSLDTFLPVVRLRPHHYEIDLVAWPKYYLYFHKLMGYVLASFLIAALNASV